jgi:UDP-N-acetylmuramate dehydrogenase
MENLELLRQHFGARLQENTRMAGLTTSRVGGPAAAVVSCSSAAELAADVQFLWQHDIPMQVLGSGSNILVSDQGVDRVILQNKAKKVVFETREGQPVVNAESGATLITIVREAAQKGFDGLVWASTIPGTLGGAVYGNAGAHGSDMNHSLVMAENLHRDKGMLSMNAEQMQYAYRSSILKRSPGSAVVLSAVLALQPGDPEAIKAAIQANVDKRRCSQPTGACFGSTFKNPVGDSAGRLIEAAGLKGTRIGGVEISTLHANFMLNDGTGCAQDYRNLVLLAQKAVFEKFGVKLELEIELIGKWQE